MKTLLMTMLLLAATFAYGIQDQSGKDEKAAPKASAPQEAQRTAYKLDVKVYELEGGKRINQRDFSMTSTAVQRGVSEASLRVGTRVPVGAGEKATYIDVGFHVDCRLTELAGKLMATFKLQMTSFALPEQSTDPRSLSMPVLRNSNQDVETILTPGKPQIVSSVDDVNSKKTMQVEVLATRID